MTDPLKPVQTEGLNIPLIRLWIADLRTEGLKKAKGMLERIDADGNLLGNCCLGRACRVAAANVEEVNLNLYTRPNRYMGTTYFDDEYELMPLIVQQAFGFDDNNPNVEVPYRDVTVILPLAELNDGENMWGIEMSLSQLADVIEKNFIPEG